MELDVVSAKTHGGIERAFDQVVSVDRKAFIGALRHWLNKREKAHTTNFHLCWNYARLWVPST